MHGRRFDSVGHYFVHKTLDTLEDSFQWLFNSLANSGQNLNDPKIIFRTCLFLFLFSMVCVFQKEFYALGQIFLNRFGAIFYYGGILRRKISGFSRNWKYRDMPELERSPEAFGDVQEDVQEDVPSTQIMESVPDEAHGVKESSDVVPDTTKLGTTTKKKAKRRKTKQKQKLDGIGDKMLRNSKKEPISPDNELELDTQDTLLDSRFVRRRDSIETGYGTYVPSIGLFRPPKPNDWLIFDPTYGLVPQRELEMLRGLKSKSQDAQVC